MDLSRVRQVSVEMDKCFKCGDNGHMISKCDLSITIPSSEIIDWECEKCEKYFTDLNRAVNHEFHCKGSKED